jgi:hypothetical protein
MLNNMQIREVTMPGAVTDSSTPKPPRLLRGSVITLRRKCGKANCRCAGGEQLHENPALSYSDGGRTRIVALRPGEVAVVRRALERYQTRRDQLDAEADAGVAALRQWQANRREEKR